MKRASFLWTEMVRLIARFMKQWQQTELPKKICKFILWTTMMKMKTTEYKIMFVNGYTFRKLPVAANSPIWCIFTRLYVTNKNQMMWPYPKNTVKLALCTKYAACFICIYSINFHFQKTFQLKCGGLQEGTLTTREACEKIRFSLYFFVLLLLSYVGGSVRGPGVGGP